MIVTSTHARTKGKGQTKVRGNQPNHFGKFKVRPSVDVLKISYDIYFKIQTSHKKNFRFRTFRVKKTKFAENRK